MNTLRIAALGAALICFIGTAAEAAVVSRKNFSKNLSASCNNGLCTLAFSAVPTRHRYEITRVSCEVYDNNQPFQDLVVWKFRAQMPASGSVLGEILIIPSRLPARSDMVNTFGVGKGLVVAKSGAALTVTAEGNDTALHALSLLDCTISGVDLKLD